MKTKKCSKCRTELLLKEFYKKPTGRGGIDNLCIYCRRQYKKEYHSKNRVRHARQTKEYRQTPRGREVSRRGHLKHKYDITPEQHEQTYLDQNGCCALCKRSVPYDKICVDHNHATNKVRGLLCQSCNQGLGYFGDTPKGIKQALEYLNRTLTQ